MCSRCEFELLHHAPYQQPRLARDDRSNLHIRQARRRRARLRVDVVILPDGLFFGPALAVSLAAWPLEVQAKTPDQYVEQVRQVT